MAKVNKLKKFSTREGETLPNPDGILVYQCLFEDEVLKNQIQFKEQDSFEIEPKSTQQSEAPSESKEQSNV